MEEKSTNYSPKVLIFGLDGAGKTTLLYQLKYSEFIVTTPTLGFNCETIFFNHLPMTFWDFGSSDPVLQFHHHYTKDTKAIIFVVDASDRERIGNARWMLRKLMEDPKFEKLPLIVIGNKIDEERAMSENEIKRGLSLDDEQGWNWCIVMTSASQKEGSEKVLSCIHICLYPSGGGGLSYRHSSTR